MTRALLVYPTHKNCEEQLQPYLEHGISAAVYPGRFTEDTDTAAANCWNEEADAAERMGLSVVETICPSCRFQSQCWKTGYMRQMVTAGAADVTFCTHKRIEYGGFDQFAQGRDYISVHENPLHLLRPMCSVSSDDLLKLQFLFGSLLNDPRWLDWFGSGMIRTNDGKTIHSDEEQQRRGLQHQICQSLADLVDRLVTQIRTAQGSMIVDPGPAACTELPEKLGHTLFRATRKYDLKLRSQPWRFLLNAILGRLDSVTLRIDRKDDPQDESEIPEKTWIVGFLNNIPSVTATFWFNDATLSEEVLSDILQKNLSSSTPHGRILLRKKAIQWPRDINRSTSARVVESLIHGLLIHHPQYQRVGIIGHRVHEAVFKKLQHQTDSRVVRWTYFGKGDERSCNEWAKECDLIVIAGTPRLSPDAIMKHLIQVRKTAAALRTPEWKDLRWTAITERGARIVVSGRGYDDPDWRTACRSLVRASLVQAIGRGRGILDEGCDVFVLSTEECGLRLAETPLEPLTETEVDILSDFSRLSLKNPNMYIIGKVSVSTSKIATDVHLSESTVRRHLIALEKRGLVRREGERGGWSLAGPFDSPPGP